jgi:hypothetical protein
MVPSPQSQLEVIYRQLGRATGFRGFTPGFLLVVAGGATVATLGLALVAGSGSLVRVALAWVCVAALAAASVFLVVLLPALRSASGIVRESAQATVRQMAFPLAAGGAVTVAILARHEAALRFLPAVWLGLFGLAVASLAGLVRERVEYAGVFYLAMAIAAYLAAPETPLAFTLITGSGFVAGHLITALLLRAPGSGAGRSAGESSL